MNTPIGKGYVHVYTGGGKGKTTASLGLAMRAVGNGLKVLIIQFLKEPGASGEAIAVERLAPELEIRSRGREGILTPSEITVADRTSATDALEEAGREITHRGWDVVVLDEINTACALGLVPVDSMLWLIEVKPDGLELVLTGRGAPAEVIEKADLVTEMREVKHYYREGVPARIGIEK
jgi:cob(I)alamin adenosyltransferase